MNNESTYIATQSNKLTYLANQLMMIEHDMEYRLSFDTQEQIDEHPTANDFIIHYFEQTWPNTSCGFGGISGQTLTAGNTVVLEPNGVNQPFLVYFNGIFAYSVPLKYWENIYVDIKSGNMAPVYQKGKYYKNK